MAAPKRVAPLGQSAPPPEPNVATTQSIGEKSAKKKATTSTPARPKAGTKYIRNIRGIGCRLTLDSGRRIEFAPRGQVGDLEPVTKEEQQDSKFISNEGMIFEIISVAEAQDVLRKQSTNAQTDRPQLIDHLRNEKGEAYERTDVRVTPAYEQQGQVVAQVEQTADGRYTEGNTDVVRRDGPPEQVAVPGSVQNPLPEIPSDIAAEDVREFYAWKQAQQIRDGLGQPIMEAPQTVEG